MKIVWATYPLRQNQSCGSCWIDCNWLAAHPPAQSLYLIRPGRLVVSLEHRICLCGPPVRKYWALFHYRGVDYNLSLTDPLLRRRLDQNFLPLGDRRTIDLGDDGRYDLCFNLARTRQGRHYKLAAALIDTKESP